MRRRSTSVLIGLAAAALAVPMLNPPAGASPPAEAAPAPEPGPVDGPRQQDNFPNKFADKRDALREKAISAMLKGKADVVQHKGGQAIQLGDQYVEYGIERQESIFNILVDFGTQVDPRFDATPGPVHGQIPEPDRNWDGNVTDDNSTYWEPNFDKAHYEELMFGEGESFKNFYLRQSNGRFLATGEVSDWVRVPFNEARYGARNNADGYWNFIKDTAKAWYDAQVAAGKSVDEIKKELADFDKWDRYDYDLDGDFNESDGYIDHFQAIHAGEGEEAGGGAQGVNAIWSHRWYAFQSDAGRTGPAGNLKGGVPIGDTGIWIGDYTTEPENGGLGVFAHEFGHDLGLPDLYDTAGGDNGTGFWTLMSGGSWLNHGEDSIGTTPGYMGAWEKLQLGWLDYSEVTYGRDARAELGPADQAGSKSQAVLVHLPNKTTTTEYNTPYSGSFEWWGGSADDLNTTLTREVDLTDAATATLSAKAFYEIEEGFDYLYGEVSTDGGATWADAGDPISATSDWTDISYDLTPYAGETVQFRFRYATDGGLHLDGPFLDDIVLTVNGAPVWTDDVESGDNGWTAKGFTRMDGTVTKVTEKYYLAENRVYSGYDETLKTGPYNFGWSNSKPDWVERFPYQNGLLVWLVDDSYGDNNTSEHPGHGLVLPVDARPKAIKFADGVLLGNRRQPFDATFGQEKTDAVTFHRNGTAVRVPSSKPIPVFDDRDPNRYWSSENPWSSTIVDGTGVRIAVAGTSKTGDEMQIQVTFRRHP